MRGRRSTKLRKASGANNLKLLLAILLGTVILILYVSEEVYIISLEKRVNDLREQHEALEPLLDNLRIEAASLRTGSRIKRIAHDSLGMRMPEGAPEKLF